MFKVIIDINYDFLYYLWLASTILEGKVYPVPHCGILRCCFLSVCFWTLSGSNAVCEGKHRFARRQNCWAWSLGHWLPAQIYRLKHAIFRLVVPSLACKYQNESLVSHLWQFNLKPGVMLLCSCLMSVSHMHALSSHDYGYIPFTLEIVVKVKPWNIFRRHLLLSHFWEVSF